MITCIGSIALDTTNTPHGKVEETPGGSGSYFALAASLLSDVSLVSAVGHDFPQDFLDRLSQKGVDISNVKIDKTGKTMRYHSTFSSDYSVRHGDLTALNVFEKFEPVLTEKQAKSHFAYLGTLTPSLQLSVIEQLEKPKLIAMDTIEYFIKSDLGGVSKVMSEVDCVVLNDAEARMICGKDNLVACGKALLKMGPTIAIVKKGEHGSILFCDDGSASPYPAFPLEHIVDPTGAGDSFAGGFMGHLSKVGNPSKAELRKAMAWGTIAGSITVEGFGVKPILDATFEIARKRYDEYRNLMHYEEA